MQDSSKTTPLHGWHGKAGANMAVFGGYDMPLWYPTGAKQEHIAVLTGAGMFDTSHMAALTVEGPGSFDLLQNCFTKDLNSCIGKNKTPIEDGRCVYGIFLNRDGTTIDDAIVYRIGNTSYIIIVNAGMGGEIAGHLNAHTGGLKAEVTDLTDRLGKIDVQGPLAARILQGVIKKSDEVFQKMPYFSFKGHFDASSPLSKAVRLTNDVPLLLSRTGYTGEFGFELFMDSSHLADTWTMILDAGSDFGITPCGLAARDSLRAGAVLPLSHQDIGHWPFLNNPWLFALPYNEARTDFVKKFLGDEALKAATDVEFTYPFAGYDLRKVTTHDSARVFDSLGNEIGEVLTCATDMAIGRVGDRIFSIASPDKPQDFKPRGLSCGFIKVKSKLFSGDSVEIRDSRRSIKVMIVDDIRPDRTARRPLKDMVWKREEDI
jgi:aminomethyltransferase